MIRRTVALMLSFLLVLSACSSTARKGAPRLESGSPGGDGEQIQSGGPTAGAPSGEASATATGRTAQGGAGGQATSALALGRPGGEIPIGILLSLKSKAAAALGASGIQDTGEPAAKALVAYLNTHGGIAGRRIKPIFYSVDVASGTFASQAQAACEHWTEDNKVFAVAGWGYDRDALLSCLAAKKTPLLKESFLLYDNELFDRYHGYFYAPSFLNGERLGIWVDQLVSAEFLTGATKIGLVRFDLPEYERATERVIKPRLSAAGLRLTDEVVVSMFHSTAELSDVAAQVQNAVLRFRTKKIDRVLILDSGSPLSLTFMTSAQGQGYFPRYGLNTLNYPAYLLSNVPKRQFVGALGVGWVPSADTFARESGGQAGLCLDIMRKAGVKNDAIDALFSQLILCSRLFLLRDALKNASTLTPAALLAGVEALGSRFDSPVTMTSRFGRGRYDGASSVRRFAYDQGCACFVYVSGRIVAP